MPEDSPAPYFMGLKRKLRPGLLDVMEVASGSKVPKPSSLHPLPLNQLEAAHRAEEIVVSSHQLTKDKESRCVAAVKAFEVAEKKSEDLVTKLAEANFKAYSASKEVDEGKDSPSKILPLADVSFEVVEQAEDAEKVDDASKKPTKNAPKWSVKENEASQHMEIVMASSPLPPKEDPKIKGPSFTTLDSTQPPKTQKDKLVIKMKS
ncbi:hypothetical protein SO802_026923 [Lithocarpus litseifolius]|uniref:Uncharacterized protein n=1 Tax=Lithocarpus litseifolius TaxID=425828 RepID=A0AAW2C340_9ROSI